MSTGQKIGFNKGLGKKAAIFKIFPVSLAKSLAPSGAVLLTLYMTQEFVGLHLPYMLYLCLWVTYAASDWILTGDKPWKFWGKFKQGKRRARAGLRFAPDEKTLKPRLTSKKVGKRTALPVENTVSIASYVAFKMQPGLKVGATLLQEGKAFKIVFALRCRGFSSTVSEERAMQIATQLQEGLKSLPQGEAVTFEFSTRSDCSERIRELQSQIDSDIQDEIKFLLKAEIQRLKGLVKVKRHNPKELLIYYTYTVGSGNKKAGDPIAGALYDAQAIFTEFFGKKADKDIVKRLNLILKDAYLRGFNAAQNFIGETLALPVTPLSADEIFARDWRRLNRASVPAIPHLLTVTPKGLSRSGDGNVHVASRLFCAGAPVEHKAYTYLPGRKTFVGCAVLDAKPNREWVADSSKDRLAQLFYGSNPINHKTVHDTTITVQFTTRNQREVLRNAENLTSEGNRAVVSAENKKRLDLASEFKRKTAMGAEWILREGGVSIRVGWVATIERDTAQDLDLALDAFCDLPQFTGGIVSKETEYTTEIWRQTMPYSWSKLLTNPWDRRLEDTTHALTCFVPLIYDRMPDRKGVAYISRNGYTPIYMDPFQKRPHKHMFKVATTGAGKSVEEIGSIISALAQGGNVIIVDSTRGDGTGTFDPLTKLVGGSYFNTGKDSYNLFQGGDFRRYPEGEDRDFAVSLFRKFLIDAIKDLAAGDDKDPKKVRLYRQIAGILIAQFLEREDIQARYDAAFDGGFGSEDWQRIPTLCDFFETLRPDSLPEMTRSPETLKALQEMSLAIGAVLARPIGQAISRPSTFRSDSKLTVVALGGLTDNEDAMPLALAASSFVLASALENDFTLFIGDESSYLAAFDSYMQIVAGFCSGGRKMGVWVHLLGQTIKRILESPFGADIVDNIDTWLIGVIQPRALPGLIQVGIPEHLLKAAVLEEGMEPPDQDVVSTWLCAQPSRGNYAQVYFPPSFAHLALGMNNKTEMKQRAAFEAKYPDDKYAAMAELSKALRSRSIHALEEVL